MTDTNLPPVIQQMLQPEFYPHPVPEPVKLIQTHVSFVLLAGAYAYKLKKPVNFGFLDFSTLAKRQHFCGEELRMNRRSAPDIYLEVLPITQTGDKYQLGGHGEPVEYTLKMRQFPQDALLINLFEAGKLNQTEMQELGKVVADFHRQTATNDYILKFGEVAQIRQAFDENYAQSEKYIGGPQTQAQFDQTKAYTDSFFGEKAALFQERIAQEKIRECHGDLHLKNIAIIDEKNVLFDCIEFNEPFRFVDTMYDVAFAVMDIEARGRKDLANVFLNTYIEQTADWAGLQLLPLYLSRQAYVRAKVTSFLLDDPGVPADQKAQAEKAAAEYYKLAWEYTQPGEGRLFLMSGVSGSGKSTTARILAEKIGAIHLRSDAVRKHLAGIGLNERGGNEIYSPEMTQKTYQRLLELGIMLTKSGFPVILDAKYDRIQLRSEAIAAAKAQSLPVTILHCTAPEAVLRHWLSQRSGDISDATADLLASQLAATEPFTEAEQPLVKTIDTTQDVAAQLATIV
ncbi:MULTISPECIES: AAA family ATPase [Planktothricoides]|uniref:gluconokinase n=1 Tax=Planktothricoides raciborskii GIHE-MW2 TaxID=2792601 RepID=A0AAU8J9U6_9CYAN|nr:AAA family ATPase [Planktothricoides sp. SR001]KOR37485.1 adenylylsulfate kinase [Planktothricoides sp. SR001]